MDVLRSYDLIDVTPAENGSGLTHEDVSSKKKKLILIQAPSNFDMNRLKGEKFLLDGQQDLAADENSDKGKRYSIKSKMNCKKSLKSFSILLPSKEDSKLKLARPLNGSISIVQSVFVPPVTFPEKEDVILPEISERRKHKWTPFGSDEPLSIEKPGKGKSRSENDLTPISEPEVKRKKSNKKDKMNLETEEHTGKVSKNKQKHKTKQEDEDILSDSLVISPEKNIRQVFDDSHTGFTESPKKKHKNRKSKR